MLGNYGAALSLITVPTRSRLSDGNSFYQMPFVGRQSSDTSLLIQSDELIHQQTGKATRNQIKLAVHCTVCSADNPLTSCMITINANIELVAYF